MLVNETRTDVPTGTLVRQAMEEARELVKTEVELAKDEVREEVRGLFRGVIAFAAAALVGLLGLAVLLVAFGIATFPHVLPSLLVGIALLVIAGIAVAIGIAALPKKPMEKTRNRVEDDVQILRERLT